MLLCIHSFNIAKKTMLEQSLLLHNYIQLLVLSTEHAGHSKKGIDIFFNNSTIWCWECLSLIGHIKVFAKRHQPTTWTKKQTDAILATILIDLFSSKPIWRKTAHTNNSCCYNKWKFWPIISEESTKQDCEYNIHSQTPDYFTIY